MTDTTPDNDYSAADLQVLEGLEAVRKRPGMYIGSTDSRGLNHLGFEIVDNAVDEALAGHCTRIVTIIHADGSVEVHDNGRGIPVDVNPRTGLTGVELVFTKLHAGGKFGGGGYKTSGGLHGVGASVVNALSSRLDVEVDRDGKTHTISFQRGTTGVFDDEAFTPAPGLRVLPGAKPTSTATRVRYWPDHQIFLPDATIDLDIVHARARQTAFLVPGLELEVRDERGDEPVVDTFRFDGGAADFVEYLAPDRPVCDPIVLTGTGTYTESIPVLDEETGSLVTQNVDREMEVDVAFRWGVGYETAIHSFVNIVATPKGGTHLAGFERALTRTIQTAVGTYKVQKATDEAPIKDDCLEGLTAVVTVKMSEPQFEGQTKEILGTAAATKAVADVVAAGLTDWFAAKANKAQGRTVLDKVAAAAKTRRELRLKKETIRRKSALESSSMPAKLADCRSDDLERTELAVVEGDSAMGTCRAGRDSEFQALLPIRGKILNTYRATEKKMLDNAECAAIITAIGAGSGKSFDIDSIRYGKVIILADADVDGAHIRTLLLTLIWRYMRPLLDAGRVYAAVPPLYRVSVSGSGENTYAYSDEERDALLADIEAQGKKVKEIQRYKGLGEMDADQLAETTLDPERRQLRRITVTDAEEAALAFDVCMGDAVAPRKDFIVTNALLVDRDRLDI